LARWRVGTLARFSEVKITTNSVGGYFSIFKRGMKRVYQHKEKHLHGYVAEFDFRYNTRTHLVHRPDAGPSFRRSDDMTEVRE
jgi:hypothetical protein